MAYGGTVKKMAEGDIVVRGGMRYIEQADGKYISEAPPFRITGTPRGGGIPSVLSTAIPPVEEVPPTEAPVVGERTTVANPRGGGITSVVPLAVAPAEDPMIRLARESAEKAADERDAAGITQSLETAEEGAAAAKAARDATQGTGEQPPGPQGGGGSGIAGAASGMTSYEQELVDALARREKAAAQDKWLALAQVGLNLMSSDQPTIGGAIGEAGLAGVQAAQGSRDQYEQDRLSLVGALEKSRMDRAAAAAAAARGAGGASVKPINATLIGNFEKKLADIQGQLGMLPPVPDPGWWSGTIDDPNAVARDDLARQAAGIQQILDQAYATHGLYPGAASDGYDGDMSDPEE
jgi:hypothetical protein